jgi:hypothetical protein
MDGPLEENTAMVGASASLPVMVRAGSIIATGELLKLKSKNSTSNRVLAFPNVNGSGRSRRMQFTLHPPCICRF